MVRVARSPQETFEEFKAWIQEQPEDRVFGVYPDGPGFPSPLYEWSREAHSVDVYGSGSPDPLWLILLEQVKSSAYRGAVSRAQMLSMMTLVERLLQRMDTPLESYAGWFYTCARAARLLEDAPSVLAALLKEGQEARTLLHKKEIARCLLIFFEYATHTTIYEEQTPCDRRESIIRELLRAKDCNDANALFYTLKESCA